MHTSRFRFFKVGRVFFKDDPTPEGGAGGGGGGDKPPEKKPDELPLPDGRTTKALADDVARIGAKVEEIDKRTAGLFSDADGADVDADDDGDDPLTDFLSGVGLLESSKKAPSTDAGGQ